jgi:hypothetical protein
LLVLEHARRLLDNPDVVLISGYARLPDTVAGRHQYERLGVVLAVERSTGRIVAADSTLITELAREFFRVLVEGLSIYDDLAEIVHRVQTRYAGQSGAALATALRRCLESGLHLRTTQRAGEDRP